jgi:GntR family transcriptional repressor for pyruvate dehydrogenase complex
LKKLIADGVLKVGDRLPSERDLSEQLGVSRTSVREALQQLEMRGLLETVHGGGSIVRNITEQEIRKPIELFLEQDKKLVLELAELRAFMEAWAAREAAEPHRRAGYHARLPRGDGRDFEKGQIRYDADVKYHTEIASATHTIYLHHHYRLQPRQILHQGPPGRGLHEPGRPGKDSQPPSEGLQCDRRGISPTPPRRR